MNIVLLDGYTLNPGDLSWDEMSKLGNFTVYDRTNPEDTVNRAKEADIVLTNKTLLSKEIIEQLPRVKYIGLLSTGTNVVDLDYTKSRNIPVTNVPAYSTPSVAQLTFAFILAFTNKVYEHHQSVINKEWQLSPDFCYWKYPLIELEGKTIGLIGFGSIGKYVAHIAQAFGMRILVYRKKNELVENVTYCSLNELLQQSDFVSLHCPLTKETEKIINEQTLAQMKQSAVLINTGRGALIDEQALANALNEGKIAGAGLDVLTNEPPVNGSPLIGAKNCIITPHIAWASKAARERLYQVVLNNIKAFSEGRLVNVVN
jgi:glycerate dehydrogenase